MCAARWYSSAFSWLDFDFSMPSLGIFRWSWTGIFDLSYFTSGWSLNLQSVRGFGSSILDDAVWTLITVVESFALACMLCFFFLFCGCTL
ncbi:hypothetical protein D8674_009550 [Pyrus ussuriensis x Pyrus communis]|uniref:Uncharacterized protein n=1 Tax=Pyrus ussuriensis x Pyrus communis TaxID=2448454 RepID=A0A5N5F892_9ROSA|nr:hypothetical protein D8674_009550 [Pyrus ussuriensis x Pyrus communis]